MDQSAIIYNNDNVPLNQFTDNRIKPKVNYSFYFNNNIMIIFTSQPTMKNKEFINYLYTSIAGTKLRL